MSKSRRPQPPLREPGDVFAVPLPSGWFGAVRVVRRSDEPPGHAYLVATTPYLERRAPEIDDPRLRQTLSRRYFAWRGNPALVWLRGAPPDGLIPLGNVPLSAEDASVDCNTFGGKWALSGHEEAYWQWRWEHDREALVAEQKQRQEEFEARWARQRRRQKPKTMLPDDDFWPLIALLGQPTDDLDAAMRGWERLVSALAARTVTDIKRFEEALTYKLFLLDTRAHAEAADNSDDGFLYARCAAVAAGPESYAYVLADPARMDGDREFEDLLSAARTAYERKTGEEFEYDTGCSYETGSNPNGWPDE
jgi:hypothetical protein